MADPARPADDVLRRMTFDLWQALGEDDELFDVLYEERGFVGVWSLALAIVKGQQRIDGEANG